METMPARRTAPTLAMAVVAIALAVVAIGVAAMQGGGDDPSLAADLTASVDEDAYQAVTLSTGTVYYGKLSTDGDALLLDDVYYLTGATEDDPSGSLVKRGAEIYAPNGAMLINPSLVVQIDQVGDDSVIARGIARLASEGE